MAPGKGEGGEGTFIVNDVLVIAQCIHAHVNRPAVYVPSHIQRPFSLHMPKSPPHIAGLKAAFRGQYQLDNYIA